MLDNPPFENGEKVLCEMHGKNAEMLMTIYVRRCRTGEKIEFLEGSNETAILSLRGEVRFTWAGGISTGKRASPFERTPYCLHFCRNTKVGIEALADSEIIVQQTENEKSFPAVFYIPETCLYQEFGKGQWNGAGHRIVSTMFDLSNAPYSNMVMGEVFNQPGKAHQQVAAPGFTMYYVWMIRHLDGDPWDKTRIYIPEYEWLVHAQ